MMIELSKKQQQLMNNLYSYCSNETNPGFSLANRSFVHGFIGLSKEDRRVELLEGIKDKSHLYTLTKDCIDAVDKILNDK